jgi:hypothetical protein
LLTPRSTSALQLLTTTIAMIGPLAAQANVAPVPAKVLLRIDADAENLSAITTLAVSSSGVLAVYLRQDRVIRLFAPDGKALATAGHKGEGPGEFRRLDAIGWIGDTLWASDPFLRRLTRYTVDGKFLRSIPAPLKLEWSTAGAAPVRYDGPMLQAVYPDGSILFQADVFKPLVSDAPKDVTRDARFAIRANAEGGVRRIVATDPPDGCKVITEDAIIGVGTCPRTLRTAAADGSRRVSVIQTAPSTGAGTVRVVAVNPDGVTIFDHHHAVRLTPITRAARDSLLEDIPSEAKSRVSAFLNVYPPAYDVRVATNGSTWIGLYAPKGSLREWQRLDPTGKQLPSIWLPASAKGLAIDGRGAWASTEAEDGSQGIVLYEARP